MTSKVIPMSNFESDSEQGQGQGQGANSAAKLQHHVQAKHFSDADEQPLIPILEDEELSHEKIAPKRDPPPARPEKTFRKKQLNFAFSTEMRNDLMTGLASQTDYYPEKIGVLLNYLADNTAGLTKGEDELVEGFKALVTETVKTLPEKSVLMSILVSHGWNGTEFTTEEGSTPGAVYTSMCQALSTLYLSHLASKQKENMLRAMRDAVAGTADSADVSTVDGVNASPAGAGAGGIASPGGGSPNVAVKPVWNEYANTEENQKLMQDDYLNNSYCPNILFSHIYDALHHHHRKSARRAGSGQRHCRHGSDAGTGPVGTSGYMPERIPEAGEGIDSPSENRLTPPDGATTPTKSRTSSQVDGGEPPSEPRESNGSITPPPMSSYHEPAADESSTLHLSSPPGRSRRASSVGGQSSLIPTSTVFQGACVLADISGFTKLSCKYCSEGVRGLDKLHDTVSHFLGKFVQIVYSHRGDVISFAGDALICIFRTVLTGKEKLNREEAAKDYCTRAIQCAFALRDHYTENLTSHIGVSCGDMSFANLGGFKQSWVYMVNGACIPELSACIDNAGSKEVVVTKKVHDAVFARRRVSEVFECITVGEGNYKVLKLETVPNKAPQHSRFHDISHLDQLMDYSRRFVPRPALESISSGTFHLLSELREVTTMFLKLDSYDPEINRDPLTLQSFFYMAQQALAKTGGFMRQFLIDDKGCVLIGMWGVPSCSYPQNGSRALNCAMTIHSGTLALNHRCSIGITTGNVFCGNIGSLVRRDFVGIGHTVNLAARLMGKSKGKIYVDEETYSYLPQDFRKQLRKTEGFKVKGVAEDIHAYICDNNLDLNFLDIAKGGHDAKRSYLPKKIAESLCVHLDRLKGALSEDRVSIMMNNTRTINDLQNIMSDDAGAKKVTAFATVIAGVQGSGKSAGALFYKAHAKKIGMKCCQIRAREVDETTPYGVIRRLFQELIGPKTFQGAPPLQKHFLKVLLQHIPWSTVLTKETLASPGPSAPASVMQSAVVSPQAINMESSGKSRTTVNSETAHERFTMAYILPFNDQMYAVAYALGLLGVVAELQKESSNNLQVVVVPSAPIQPEVMDVLVALCLRTLIKKMSVLAIIVEDVHLCEEAAWNVFNYLFHAHFCGSFLMTTRKLGGMQSTTPRSITPSEKHQGGGFFKTFFGGRAGSKTDSSPNQAAAAVKVETPTSIAYNIFLKYEHCLHVQMAPLNFREVKKLMEQSLKSQNVILSDKIIQIILEISSGNVFWCKEIASFILERGVNEFKAKVDGGISDEEKTVTNPLQVLVICRLEKMTTEQQVALRHAALIGDEFSYQLFVGILPPKLARSIDNIVKALVNASFIEISVEDSEKIVFSNMMIRQILCYLTPPGDAAKIHKVIAENLELMFKEDMHNQYSTLAYHYHHGGDVCKPRALRFYIKAADEALSRAAFIESYGFCSSAFELAELKVDYRYLEKVVSKAISDLSGKSNRFSSGITSIRRQSVLGGGEPLSVNRQARANSEPAEANGSGGTRPVVPVIPGGINENNEKVYFESMLADIQREIGVLEAEEEKNKAPLKGVTAPVPTEGAGAGSASASGTGSNSPRGIMTAGGKQLSMRMPPRSASFEGKDPTGVKDVQMLGQSAVQWKLSYTDPKNKKNARNDASSKGTSKFGMFSSHMFSSKGMNEDDDDNGNGGSASSAPVWRHGSVDSANKKKSSSAETTPSDKAGKSCIIS